MHDGGKFILSAGDRRVVIHTPDSKFAGQDVVWEIGSDGDAVFVDGICYHGEKQEFDFGSGLEIVAAAGIELLLDDETATNELLKITSENPTEVEAVWRLSNGESLVESWTTEE